MSLRIVFTKAYSTHPDEILHSVPTPSTEVIKLFSCSTYLSMKFQMLIKGKMMKNNDLSCFKTLRYCIYPANKC